MRGSFSFTISLVLLTFLSGCSVKHIAYRDRPHAMTSNQQAKTIPVFLPRTVLKLEATLIKSAQGPGEFYLAALKDIPPSTGEVAAAASTIGVDLITASSTNLKVANAKITTRGERDPSQLFHVLATANCLTQLNLCTELSEEGVIGKISSDRADESVEFAFKTLESLAAIAGKAVGLGSTISMRSGPGGRSKVGEAAQRVLLIREERKSILDNLARRPPPADPGLMRVLELLDREEAGLVRAIAGWRNTESVPVEMVYRPERDKREQQVTLLELVKGCTQQPPSPRVSHSEVPTDFFDGLPAGSDRIELRLDPVDLGEAEVLDRIARTDRRGGEKGLPYQVPARVMVRMITTAAGSSRELSRAETLIAQWGKVGRLPVTSDALKSAIKPTYYTETGALKVVEISTTAIGSDSTQSLSTAAGSVLDAVKAAKEADTETARLKRETDRINAEIGLEKARRELEQLR